MDTASDRIAQGFTWASLAVLYYDYSLTFNEEVEYIWGLKFTSSTLLYILCRYAMIANLLYLLAHLDKIGLRWVPSDVAHITKPKLDTASCDTWYKIIAVLGVLGRAAVIVTFTLRTYVVWAQSRIVLTSLVMLGIATVLTDAVCINSLSLCGLQSRGKPDRFTFHVKLVRIREETRQLDIVRSLLTIVFETLSATLIFIRSLQAFRKYSNQHSFTYFLMQEGAVYFCIVSLFTVATFVLKVSTKSSYLHDLLNAFTLPLSGLLTARFLLHLRAWNKARTSTVSCTAALDVESQQRAPSSRSHTSISSVGIQLVSATASLNSEPSDWLTTAEFGEDPMLKSKEFR
ncbi:hypothetical protein F5050DRAFT_1811422 [Lentinula boryana]|uniref:DUF6533 domain-containing protein n=1 Tax=Lentinula boryana TaxID=40481 RepID=A0ABQ8Q1F7_9AGAR|nr:hypothetical protein F5050DRAFT_1811422 [Lentinula boryana]